MNTRLFFIKTVIIINIYYYDIHLRQIYINIY